MTYHFSTYPFALLFSALLCAAAGLTIWRRTSIPGGRAFSLLTLAMTIWQVGAALAYAAPDLTTNLRWIQAHYVGVEALPVCWFAFVAAYTGREDWLTPRNLLALSLLPALTVGIAFTNESHGWLWTSVEPGLVRGMPIYVRGPWFWINSAYLHGLNLSGAALLLKAALEARGRRREHYLLLLGAAILPLVLNFAYIINPKGLAGVNLTPFAFTISALLLGLIVFRFRLFEAVPVAQTALPELLPAGILVFDEDRRTVLVNPAARELFGWRDKPVLGCQATELFSSSPDLTKLMWDGEISREIRVATDTGDRWLEIRGATLRDDRDRESGRLITCHDVTTHKQAQHDLQRAKELAEKANRTKTEFLANVSHDLRTPMNAIVGMAQLLNQTELTPEQARYVSVMRSSSEALLSLINDILDLSRIEAGHLRVEAVPFGLSGLVERALQDQHAFARGKGLHLSVQLAPSIPEKVVGAEDRIRQILSNLVNNAIKFTDSGGVVVSLGVEEATGEAPSLVFAVTDSGIGMTEELRARIFAPFIQGDSSSTRSRGGSGLGLAIVARLVELLGGTLAVESMVGRGSTFRVRIPVRIAPLAEPEPRIDPAPKASVGRPNRILIADDQASNLFFAAEVLRKLGHPVLQVRNGQEAVEAWERHRPDMILMDIQMPVMDGVEAMRRIRQREAVAEARGKHVPIVAVTAHAIREEREAILAQGFDGYLAKPLLIEDLLDEMARIENAAARHAA